MSKKTICVVTGTRADYGLLYWLMKEIHNDQDLKLQLMVTGMHLSPEFGLTYRVIEQDGFRIDARVEMLLSSDSAAGIAKSIGLGVIGFADAIERLKPDIMVVLGDRFEILAAVQAALVARIPVAHIAGGDVTEGVYDEAIRHSITKMSHLHFVTNEHAYRRVCQMGENPNHVFNVGSPGLDYIRRMTLLERDDLQRQLGFQFRQKNFLVTFHPVTLDPHASRGQFQELLDALTALEGDTGLIFTLPNADNEGRELIDMVKRYVSSCPHAVLFKSLGQHLYLNTMAQVDVIIGNSSSGLYEAPSFKKPTVDIGDRQSGRLRASSVINCGPDKKAIIKAVQSALAMDCSGVVNPYGNGESSIRIAGIIKNLSSPGDIVKKKFHDLDENRKQ
jgi:UDP-hydrolysing UDP-N-acetyl-D-glucosamine 2-epimerase